VYCCTSNASEDQIKIYEGESSDFIVALHPCIRRFDDRGRYSSIVRSSFASLAQENPFVALLSSAFLQRFFSVSPATILASSRRATGIGVHCSSNVPLVTDSARWLRIRPMSLRFINIDVPRNASEFAGMHAARRICGERVIQRGRSARALLRRLNSATKLTPRVTSQFAGSRFVSPRHLRRRRTSFRASGDRASRHKVRMRDDVR